MERLHYKVEFADNGVIIKNTDANSVEVYQSKDGLQCIRSEDKSEVKISDYREYTRRAISEGIANCIADLLLDGSDNLKVSEKFKINIAIF